VKRIVGIVSAVVMLATIGLSVYGLFRIETATELFPLMAVGCIASTACFIATAVLYAGHQRQMPAADDQNKEGELNYD